MILTAMIFMKTLPGDQLIARQLTDLKGIIQPKIIVAISNFEPVGIIRRFDLSLTLPKKGDFTPSPLWEKAGERVLL